MEESESESESESEMDEEDENDDDDDVEGVDESLRSQEGSVIRDPVARYDGGDDAKKYGGGFGIQLSRSSTPRGRRSGSASLSPTESWVSLSNGSFASGGSVVRYPELGSGDGREEG